MKKGNYILIAVAVISVLLTACAKDPEYRQREIVILDCDMGCMNDDTLALSMLMQAEKENRFEIAGITLEGGNFFIDAEFESEGELQTCEWDNTNGFLEKTGRTDIPVYRGTDYPVGFDDESLHELADFYKNAEYLPFNDEYGAIHAYESIKSGAFCDSDEAADFMIECVKENPGNVVIIATGPAMNIANAIRKDPSFAGNVKAVYYMCGALGELYDAQTTAGKNVKAVGGANVTPYTEYNALYDPLALYICLTAGFPKQYITPAELNIDFDGKIVAELKLKAGDSKVAKAWYEHFENSIPQYPYWDPITAFSYLKPERIINAEEKYITVNTDREDDRFGETTAIFADDFNALSVRDKLKYGKVTVVNEVENFWDETVQLLCNDQKTA